MGRDGCPKSWILEDLMREAGRGRGQGFSLSLRVARLERQPEQGVLLLSPCFFCPLLWRWTEMEPCPCYSSAARLVIDSVSRCSKCKCDSFPGVTASHGHPSPLGPDSSGEGTCHQVLWGVLLVTLFILWILACHVVSAATYFKITQYQ